jgi:hypothetical protein
VHWMLDLFKWISKAINILLVCFSGFCDCYQQACWLHAHISHIQFRSWHFCYGRAHGSGVVKALRYKPEGRGFETQWGEWLLSIYLILPAALGLGVYSTSNRNEYRVRNKHVSGERAQPVREADNLTAHCVDSVGSSTSHNPIGLHGMLLGLIYFSYFIYLLWY